MLIRNNRIDSRSFGKLACCTLILTAMSGSTLLAQAAASKLPTDLRTRTFGSDWPHFLGPNQDSKSQETGIIKNWSTADGTPAIAVKWQLPLKQSYGTCTTSRGRLFQFDSEPTSRRGESIGKVLCLNSETGQQLWEYKYAYSYSDQYGYNDGRDYRVRWLRYQR